MNSRNQKMPTVRKALTVATLAAVAILAACSTSWIQTAQQYVAILVPAVQDVVGILQIAGVKGVSATDVSLVSKYAAQATTDLQSISTLLTQYNAVPPSGTTTTVQKIDAAANDARENLGLILPALHITDPRTVSKVTGAVNLAVNTIVELQALLPAQPPNGSAKLGNPAVKPPKPRDLQNQFNQIFGK